MEARGCCCCNEDETVAAAQAALDADLDPMEDLNGPPAMKMHLARVLNETVGPATDGRYELDVDAVDVSPWTGDLAVSGIRLRLTDGLPGPGVRTRGPALRFSGEVGRVSIEGVRLWRLVRDHDLEATAFRVEAPRVGIIVSPREAPPAGEDPPGLLDPETGPTEDDPSPGGTTASDSTRHGTVARRLPHIHVGRVAVEEVDVTLVTLRGDEALRREAPLTERLRPRRWAGPPWGSRE